MKASQRYSKQPLWYNLQQRVKKYKNGLSIAMQFLPSQAINFHKQNVDTNAVGHTETVNKILLY
jgi:lipid A disaccharide synthetase